MTEIIITNTQCKLMAGPHIKEDVVDAFKLRVKGAFFSEAFQKRQWDGYKRYVTPTGMFELGLLPEVVKFLKENLKEKVTLIDQRDSIEPDEEVLEVGNLVLRPYQAEAVKAFLENKVRKIPFLRGILEEATNAGKNLISAAIHLSFPEDKNTVFFIHNQLIHTQAVKELTELLGKDQVGILDSKQINPKRFTICMVQSTCAKIRDPKVKRLLANADICIVDECHRAGTKQYNQVLSHLYNCPIRVGVSGTPLNHKDPNRNRLITAFFGPIIHKVDNRELVEQGYSTLPKIKIILGETRYKMGGDYKGEYDKVITNNKRRNKMVWRRVSKAIAKDRLPVMILCKYINHTKNLLKTIPKDIKESLRVGVIHNQVKKGSRHKVLEDFKNGKLDILIATHIIKEGQNMPLIQYSINAGGSDSYITIIQWLGRMLRKHHSKKVVHIEDIFDTGVYLKRHSKHRVKFFKSQGFPVNEQYKVTAKRKSITIH